jgi:hypothetical protein
LCQSFSIGWFPEKLDPNGNGIIVEYAFTGYWFLVSGCWLLATGYWLLVNGF